jgi:hypothetical protein
MYHTPIAHDVLPTLLGDTSRPVLRPSHSATQKPRRSGLVRFSSTPQRNLTSIANSFPRKTILLFSVWRSGIGCDFDLSIQLDQKPSSGDNRLQGVRDDLNLGVSEYQIADEIGPIGERAHQNEPELVHPMLFAMFPLRSAIVRRENSLANLDRRYDWGVIWLTTLYVAFETCSLFNFSCET